MKKKKKMLSFVVVCISNNKDTLVITHKLVHYVNLVTLTLN